MAVRGVDNGGWVAVGFTGLPAFYHVKIVYEINYSDDVFAMVGADAVIGWPETLQVTGKVAHYQLTRKQVSGIIEDELPLSDVYSERVDGITTIIFTRPLNAFVISSFGII